MGAIFGVSTSKTLAKLGSDAAKPFGVRVLLGDAILPLLREQPVSEVCGISARSVEKLAGSKTMCRQKGAVVIRPRIKAD